MCFISDQKLNISKSKMENIVPEKEDSEKMILELESIAQAIIQGKENMTIGIKKMQNESEARDRERKKIILCEMKKVLSMLKTNDEVTVKEFKNDAFDKSVEVMSIFEEVNAIQCAIKNQPTNTAMYMEHIRALRVRAENICLEQDFLATSSNIKLSHLPGMNVAKIQDWFSDSIFAA